VGIVAGIEGILGWMMKEAFREGKTETKCTHQGESGKTSRKLKTKRRKEVRERRPRKSTTPETARKTERSRDGNNRKEEGKKVGGGEKKTMKNWKSQI
jgi:hypothetical protein